MKDMVEELPGGRLYLPLSTVSMLCFLRKGGKEPMFNQQGCWLKAK